jgi:uncharacterized protein YcgI (DUF1989 family)
MGNLVYGDTLPGGKHWSLLMRRNTRLRLTDVEGGANIGMLFYNPQNLLERYNAPDTLKCQHTFQLTAGHCLYSDVGRIFCSVVSDTFGWHDTVSGNTTKATVARKWGEKSYQTAQRLAAERARQLSRRRGEVWTWPPRLGGERQLVQQNRCRRRRRDVARYFGCEGRRPGRVALEIDTLVLFHTCPHPLDLANTYPRKPASFETFEGPPAALDDPARLSAPENARGFENNRIFLAGCCGDVHQ